jgi:branched-chain amino acid transport system ATP-binding protein
MNDDDQNSLVVEGLFTAYDKANVLENVSLTAAAGKITCLLGSNGSGKTTLIRSILGLTPPNKGRIRFGGEDLTGLATHRIIAAGIACIPEGRRVFPKLTVEENLRIGAYQEASDAVIARRLAEVYATFPRLAERRGQLAGTMSGGEQAMVSIGRGLMRAPRLLLVDEPSLGLAPILVDRIYETVAEINRQGTTILLVEQNANYALEVSSRGYVLETGMVALADESDALRRNPEVQRAYLGAA